VADRADGMSFVCGKSLDINRHRLVKFTRISAVDLSKVHLIGSRGFTQKIELRWKSFLCGPLRISAFSALMGLSTQRAAEIRRGRREKKSDFPLFVQSRPVVVCGCKVSQLSTTNESKQGAPHVALRLF